MAKMKMFHVKHKKAGQSPALLTLYNILKLYKILCQMLVVFKAEVEVHSCDVVSENHFWMFVLCDEGDNLSVFPDS